MDIKREHHIDCKKGEVGKYVLLTGDPDRVPIIAQQLDGHSFLRQKREYVTWNGFLDGELVTVCSTGIGGPSAAIAMEELAACGASTFIRIGTCGGLQKELIPGDLIIANGAIRKDGASKEYAPIEFPAVAHDQIISALKQSAIELNLPYHVGIVECKDSYYGQHRPESMPTFPELNYKWNAWITSGALASEMESSTLFVVGSVRRLKVGTVLLLCRNKEREKAMNIYDSCWDTSNAIKVAINALRKVITEDKSKANP